MRSTAIATKKSRSKILWYCTLAKNTLAPKSYGKLRSQNKKAAIDRPPQYSTRTPHTAVVGEKEREGEKKRKVELCCGISPPQGDRFKATTCLPPLPPSPPLRAERSQSREHRIEVVWRKEARMVEATIRASLLRSAAAVCCRSSPPLFCGHLTRDGMVFFPLSESGWDWSAAVLGPDFSFEGRGSKDTTSEGQTDRKPIYSKYPTSLI